MKCRSCGKYKSYNKCPRCKEIYCNDCAEEQNGLCDSCSPKLYFSPLDKPGCRANMEAIIKTFRKKLQVSNKLEDIIGLKYASRPQVVKKIWAYIKKNKLQHKENRRMINNDKKMKVLFGKKECLYLNLLR